VDPGANINGQYYRDVLLQKLLPAIQRVSGNMFPFPFPSASSMGHDWAIALQYSRLHCSRHVAT